MKTLKNLIKFILLVSIVVFGLAFLQKDNLPQRSEILDQLYQEPVQVKTDMEPFEIEKEIVYQLTPLYDYELYGLVVSYHHSKSWMDYYHQRWKDFINIKDICVVWGQNIMTGVYENMTFKSGSWTCYPGGEWAGYDGSALSNNHLLSADEAISEAILQAQTGDQVYLKGYLVEYSHSNGSWRRGTSVIREDNGCETIFVTDFRILKKANAFWHLVFKVSRYSIICCFILLVILFFATPILKPGRDFQEEVNVF